MAAPNKAEREKCWIARDSFWKCLEDNNDDADKCKSQRQQFEGSCNKQWVSINVHIIFVLFAQFSHYGSVNVCNISHTCGMKYKLFD